VLPLQGRPHRLTPCRALRLLRLSLLVGNLPNMRLSKGALLAGAVNVPLLTIVASIISWWVRRAAPRGAGLGRAGLGWAGLTCLPVGWPGLA
jgi:hypothetical protein